MLIFKYSVAVSISSFVFSEIEAEVEWLKTSLKSCQLVSWLWIRPLGGFSIIAEPTVAITGEWSEESSVEELIWTCLGEIFLVMKKLSKSGILLVSVGQYVGLCIEVVEIVGGYAMQEVFASWCDKSAAPLGMFGVIVSSTKESIA